MIKVLYIDDEADTEKMASKFEIMREEGIYVIPVARISDVLPTLNSNKDSVNVIVLDLIMPPEDVYTSQETEAGTLTGLRLLEDIRRYTKETPVIVVSIRRRPSAEGVLSRYGISEYLEKPISASDLVQSIKEHLTQY